MKRLLSSLSATIGALMGVIFLLFVAAFCAELVDSSNTLGQGFFIAIASPFALVIGTGVGIWLGLRIAHALQRETDSAKKQRIEFRLVAGVLLLYPGSLALMGWGISLHGAPPSDSVLLANFDRKEAVFNQLVSMVETDKKLVPINENWTTPDIPNTTSFTNIHVNEYRQLLRTANIPLGFRVQEDREIRFYYYIRGSAISSDRIKGYAFLTTPPMNLRKQLDDCDREFLVYRHVRGNWYLFYQYIPG